MRRIKDHGISPLQLAVAAGIALLGVGLLTESAEVSQGVRTGLEVCGGVLIPSLFPFMVLSGFLSRTDYARILSIPLGWVTTRIYKLPRDLGVVVLLSMIGGYPVGAKMIADLLDQGRIGKATAERMLCFCVNSGPSFLITAVGAGLYLNKAAGAALFATQTVATLLIGWLVSLKTPRPREEKKREVGVKPGPALVLAVSGAASAMIAMCAFAILFSGILAMISASGLCGWIAEVFTVREEVVTAVVSGFFEVTSGCVAAARIGGQLSFGLTSAIVSFSGLSVLFQIMSCFGGKEIRFRPLILARLGHGILSTAMAVPLYRLFYTSTSVYLASAPPVMQADSKTTLISVCLLAMCAIFSLSLGDACKK